jgi:hypothetical protein
MARKIHASNQSAEITHVCVSGGREGEGEGEGEGEKKRGRGSGKKRGSEKT